VVKPPVKKSPTPLPGTLPYQVRRGDTLYSIAKRYGTTVEALVSLNGEAVRKGIKAGQVILVPSPDVPEFVAGEKFRWPALGRVVAGFGERLEGARIEGLEIALPEGTPVKASRTGVVTYVSEDFPGFGGLVVMRHGDYRTVYARLSEIYVQAGRKVGQGFVIGRSGRRLHFRIYRGREALDPLGLLER